MVHLMQVVIEICELLFKFFLQEFFLVARLDTENLLWYDRPKLGRAPHLVIG